MKTGKKTTRRGFLQTAAGAPLGLASLAGLRSVLLPCPAEAVEGAGHRPALQTAAAARNAAAAARFPKPEIIRYDAQCFTIHGKDTFLVSASMHYPRCPRPLWRDRLEKLQAARFNCIETYIPWNYHEPEEGRADMSEFEAYLDLLHEMGFWVIARPGPYICAEWESGGFPRWVIAKQFPLRSNDPQSIATSQHWYDLVLPAIKRKQITEGGPVILMQVENEYDYWGGVSDDAKREYVTALAEMSWKAGIEIPLITCWTKQVRERGNAAMERVADFCNFYPRWDIPGGVAPRLAKLRADEPYSPVGVTELQGGWFAQFGGKLSVDQPGVDAAQLNALTKTVIEDGATLFNYYMGFGGTNFDWASKKQTTTYDYAAPLREPGGLWDKFYEARGIGESLALFGDVLLRAKQERGAAQTDNPAVSATLRMNANRGVLFLRENKNAPQRFKVTLTPPGGNPGDEWTIPIRGELKIGPREMKMLPIAIQIPYGGGLRYTTAELLAFGGAESSRTGFVALYEQPGRPVEFAVDFESQQHAKGEIEYEKWDDSQGLLTVGMIAGPEPKLAILSDATRVFLLPRATALRSWKERFSAPVDPARGRIFISDAAVLAGTQGDLWPASDLRYAPGAHELLVTAPANLSGVYVNGNPAQFSYDKDWGAARLQVTTPEIPAKTSDLREFETWIERFDTGADQWQTIEAQTAPAGGVSALHSLDDLSAIQPYGYVKYHRHFDYAQGDPTQIALHLYADDGAKIFLNGTFAGEVKAFGERRDAQIELASALKPGKNTLDIAYELFSSPNFGKGMSERKGVQSAILVPSNGPADAKPQKPIADWRVQMWAPPMRGRELDPNFAPAGGWSKAALVVQSGANAEPSPVFLWARAPFALPQYSAAWQIPWKAHIEADCDALLYLNGKFVGRYMTIGPQSDFYLPESYFAGFSESAPAQSIQNAPNTLALVLAYTETLAPLKALRIEPYAEYATYRTSVLPTWTMGGIVSPRRP